MRDFEDAVVAFQREQDRRDLYHQTVDANAESVRIANDQYANGVSGYQGLVADVRHAVRRHGIRCCRRTSGVRRRCVHRDAAVISIFRQGNHGCRREGIRGLAIGQVPTERICRVACLGIYPSDGCMSNLLNRHYFKPIFCTTKMEIKGKNSPKRSRLGRVFVPAFSKAVCRKHSK